MVNAEYRKWLTKLLGFDFDIEYKPGLENRAANALSRKSGDCHIYALSIPSVLLIDEVIKAETEDQFLGRIRAAIKNNPSSYLRYALVQGFLLCKDRITLPKDSSLVLLALQKERM